MSVSEITSRQQNLLRAFLLVYVVLVLYTIATGDPLVSLLVDVIFSVAIAVVGVLIVATSNGETLGVTTGVAFLGSGVAQAVELLTGLAIAATTSNILLLAGLGLYLYARAKNR
ncbi:hypothetical protein SAMN04487949_0836 [Halogranum gelatinilyticum]|uniref:Uncharacterized protein n=1 Tax=Halogranum gelatinilyticum TaxID=660521 RepID=A0A1G9QFE8_9EURY|nr:hypothetical protein [Halogranum gelatinilyticum]SDM09739.1 hypothetical protein SAMN04487949_0836 [Halogranum gelatinilyticum]